MNEGMFYVILLHEHGSDRSSTPGKLNAPDHQTALDRARLWIQRKQKECGCAKHGGKCTVSVRPHGGRVAQSVIDTAEAISAANG